jgi:hypothetical protein
MCRLFRCYLAGCSLVVAGFPIWNNHNRHCRTGFIKWLGNRTLFIGAAFALIATIFSFTAKFNILLVSRIAAGIMAVIAVSAQMFLSTYEGKRRCSGL